MPVKLGSNASSESAEARIEIVPLIDIMFFLLASFMLVSLSMVNLKSVKVNLPTATTAGSESKKNLVDVSVDKAGRTYLDKQPIAPNEMVRTLASQHRANAKLRVLVSGDQDARWADVVRALDSVRSAGVDSVSFDINPQKSGNP